jgi:hypothetical protein
MPIHKFHIGQTVLYRSSTRIQDAPGGAYEITRRLPQNTDGQFEYRIRSSREAHERLAGENELIEAVAFEVPRVD